MHFMWSSILDLRILSYFLAIYISATTPKCAHFPQFGPLNKNKYFFYLIEYEFYILLFISNKMLTYQI